MNLKFKNFKFYKMSSKIVKIGLCHWDGYETKEKKCSLVKGAEIIKNRFGLSLIKIYAGNKYNDIYNDFSDTNFSDTNSGNIKTLKNLIESGPYKTVLDMNFKTVVMVGFCINKSKDDDYWRVNGIDKCEINQFNELSDYLSNTYQIEFIISNWESIVYLIQ